MTRRESRPGAAGQPATPGDGRPSRVADAVLLASGIVCFVLGVAVMLGWHVRSAALVQVAPGFAPMRYVVALAFVFSGMALLAALREAWRLVLLSGVAVAAIGLLAITEHLGTGDIGIDLAPGGPFPPFTSHPGRPALSAAVCFAVFGVILILFSAVARLRRRAGVLGLVGAALIAVGAVRLSGYLLGFRSEVEWGDFGRMAFNTAAGLMVAGAGLIALMARQSVVLRLRASRLAPYIVAAGCAAAAVDVWWAMVLHERGEEQVAISAATARVAGRIEAAVAGRVHALERMARRWERAGEPREQDWAGDAGLYLRDFGFLAIAWADASQEVRWIVPAVAEGAAIGADLGGEAARTMREEARARHAARFTRSLDLPGGPGFLVAVPIFRGESFEGCIEGALRYRDLLGAALGGAVGEDDYDVVLREGAEEVVRRHQGPARAAAWQTARASLGFPGAAWQVEASLGPRAAARVETPVDEVVLYGGLLFALLFGMVIRFGQNAHARAREVGAVNRDLRREMAARADAEQALRENEARCRRVFESGLIGIAFWDDRGAILDANDEFLRIAGCSREDLAAGGLNWRDMRPPDQARLNGAALQEISTTGSCTPFETECLRRDGSRVPILLGATALEGCRERSAGFVLDLTARRRLEDHLRQSQKLEGIGQLAGGVAHDFNNLLTAIGGYTELALARVPGTDAAAGHLEAVRKAVRLASDLTRQLLAFSRKQVLEPRVLDLGAVVTQLEKMLRRLIGENIELVAVTEPGLGRVRADPAQIEQIILNLAVNARDAMPDGGKLTLETSNVTLDDPYSEQHVTMPPGAYVMLGVSDTGVGMDAATRARIFEPFFTTKELGKGTGLGLATVYGIVKQTDGYIWVTSEPGRGSTFRVYFPRVDEPADAPQAERAAGGSLRGAETLLLVEDDAMVRELVRDALAGYGYTVLAAADGESALRLAREHPGPIGLLITDVVMPRLDGRRLAEQMVQQRPGIRVLFVSGYARDAVAQHGVLDPGTVLLQKPFTPEALAKKVREVLEGAAPADPAPAAG